MSRADEVRRNYWLLPLVGLLVIVALLAGAFAILRGRIPETVVSSSFSVCGQSVEMNDGFVAYDFGSLPNAEVPAGARSIHVRAEEPGTSAPERSSRIFERLPRSFSDMLKDSVYEEWQPSTLETESGTFSETRLGVAEFANDCSVSLSLADSIGTASPRPTDWSIIFYETTNS